MLGANNRVACRLLAVAALFAGPSAPALASESAADWSVACAGFERLEVREERAVAARECALALERKLGPDDRRLVGRYSRIAERLSAGRGGAAAAASLPYRRRAYSAALRLFGATAPETGQAALDYARAKILAGRCEAHSPEAMGLLRAAAAGMRGAAGDARLAGLRDVSRGFADSLAYRAAADLLLEAGGADGAALTLADWERIGLWRHRLGDAASAAAAYRRALDADPGLYDRRRIRQSLRQALFEAGDLDALRAMSQ